MNPAAPAPAVRLADVSAAYDRRRPVFTGADLVIDGPGLVRVHGRNGGGKSTLIELVSGYLRPLGGQVRIGGLPAHDPRAHERRRVCRTEPALYPLMDVHDHVVFASRWAGADPAEGLARAERYGLGPWMHAPAQTLSTGNRRRLWIVQCTVGAFDTVVLDEPFNGLDGESSAVLAAELAAWARTRCVVLICHLPPPGLTFDRVVRWPPGQAAADPAPPADPGVRP